MSRREKSPEDAKEESQGKKFCHKRHRRHKSEDRRGAGFLALHLYVLFEARKPGIAKDAGLLRLKERMFPRQEHHFCWADKDDLLGLLAAPLSGRDNATHGLHLSPFRLKQRT